MTLNHYYMTTEALTPDTIAKNLKEIPEWTTDDDLSAIARTYTLNDFQRAIVFVNLVAKIADEANHHPDIFIHQYNNVTVSLTTHSAGGLTEMDFAVAKSIDALTQEEPEDDS